MKFGKDIHVAQMMHPTAFDDLLTSLLAPPAG